MTEFRRATLTSQSRRLLLSTGLLALLVGSAVALTGQANEPTATAEAPAAKAQHGKHPPNRLARETSPYLLLHAHNPVDWYPWGEEALAKARAEKKLIFLSIGYSSCYWCHVMERESFLDEEVAKVLNKNFVCIKVDREERPDIDQVYMTALSAMGRHGGWPLTMILTPDTLPIFGGTYFPPRDKEVELPQGADKNAARQKVTGLLTVLQLVIDSWSKNPTELRDYATAVASAVRRGLRQQAAAPAVIDRQLAAKTVAALADQFDAQYGGFGYSESNPRRPKFPEPSNLVFLLDYLSRQDDAQSVRMLEVTLDRMAAGGIRDHLGGGFHRYSTDRYWRVPHFEKMLYDNAQLASVYAAAFKKTGRDEYRRVTDEILQFVVRELTSPEGAFWSALDAETDSDEGQYYVWTGEQLAAVLDASQLRLLGLVYGTAGEPNFEGRYVLEQVRPIDEIAKAEGTTVEALRSQLASVREKLMAARDKRQRPLTDDKILTAWNGLMIRGFADAGRLLDDEKYVAAAAKAAEFVLAKLRTPEGRLLRSFAGGKAQLNAYLDDYAFFVDGLIALHEATGDERWLTAAEEITRKQIELFADNELGGFYFTSDDHEQLLARSKDPVDSALPSGNSVAAANLVYLGRKLDKPEYIARAKKTLACFAGLLNESPAAVPRMVVVEAALDAHQNQKPAP